MEDLGKDGQLRRASHASLVVREHGKCPKRKSARRALRALQQRRKMLVEERQERLGRLSREGCQATTYSDDAALVQQ
jgi:hypothetical protein